MCQCDQSIKTPFCGRPGCEWPAQIEEMQTPAAAAPAGRTRDRLAAELRKVAAEASPINGAKYEAFARRAETGEFDDYAETYVCPVTQLYGELMAAGFTKFAARVAGGEFDATRAESDEWARSPAGQEAAKMLSPAVRKALGMDLPN